MTDDMKFLLRTTWGPRKESLEQCARRTEQCLKELRSCDEVFSHWTSDKPFAIEQTAILEAFREEEKEADFRENLGHLCFLGGGLEQPNRVELSTKCSSFHPIFVNFCNLTLPGIGDAAERLIWPDMMSQLLGVLVRAWEPDFGEVMTSEFFDSEMGKQTNTRPECPLVGWMIYLSNARGPLPTLPPRYSVVPVDGLGNIVVTTRDRFSHDCEEHVQAAKMLRDLLNGADLLGPISTMTV